MPSVAPSSVLKVLTGGLIAGPGSVGEVGAPPPEAVTLPPTSRSSGFHEKDGKAYCRKDYFDMFAPKCGGCARAILENYISALNTLWHPECFVCRVRRPLPLHLKGTRQWGEKGLPHCVLQIQLGSLLWGYTSSNPVGPSQGLY